MRTNKSIKSIAVSLKPFKLVKATEFGMVNFNMAVCLDNEVACPVRMVTVQ